MLVRHAVYAGLITGFALLLAVLTGVVWRGLLGGVGLQAIPLVLAPLVLTGIAAVRKAEPWIRGPGKAALAGAIAGLMVGLLASPIFYLAMYLQVVHFGISPTPWTGFPDIFSEELRLPTSVFLLDVPVRFPFWWPLTRTTASGATVTQFPLLWVLFVPIGVSLSALQAWLYFLIVRRLRPDAWAVRTVAHYRAQFQRKLMLGFIVLGLMIFAVGWLGFATLEEMHQAIHRGRVMQHFADHVVGIQANLRAESETLNRAADDPSATNLQAVSATAKLVADELAHLKQVPPPSHPPDVTTNVSLPVEAAKRLPAVREADARFAEYDGAVTRILDLLRAGNAAEARSQLVRLEPARRALDTALVTLGGDLNRDLVAWAAETDTARHSQEQVMLVIVLLAAGAAFPLGYVLSQVVVRPVDRVSQGLRRIGSGDFSTHIKVENRDELGELAERVNQMNDELARLYDELQARTRALARSVEQQQALAEINRAVSSSLDLQTVLTSIVAHAAQLSGTEAGAIYAFDEATQTFTLQVTHEMSDELVAGIRRAVIGLDDPVIGLAARTRAATQVADIHDEPAFAVQKVLLEAGFRSVLAVPLLREERVVGALVVRRKSPGLLDAASVDVLQAFATQSVLAIRNAQLFQEVEETGRQLQIASQHKSQFLANMSHELRTPLNAILGYTELIVDGIYGEPPERIREVLDRVEKSGRHLLGLINDVLDLSKMEAGQLILSVDDYSIQQAIQTAIMAVESLAAEKGLALTVELAADLPPGRGDERRLTQVLLNLIGNAIKFTEAGSVTVTATAAGEEFVVSVRDTGRGISEEDQLKIFEEFQQADSTSTRQQGGTGLGLAIARRIVELHGGRIWVDSRPGDGSTFTFTVPVCATRQEVAA